MKYDRKLKILIQHEINIIKTIIKFLYHNEFRQDKIMLIELQQNNKDFSYQFKINEINFRRTLLLKIIL